MVNIISHSCPRCNSYSLYKYGKDKFGNQKYQCRKCKHQFAPDFVSSGSRGAKPLPPEQRKYPSCPVCGKSAFLHHDYNDYSNYRCSDKKCNHSFFQAKPTVKLPPSMSNIIGKDNFKRMRHSLHLVITALTLFYIGGTSFRKITTMLEMLYNIKVSHVTISDWCKKFAPIFHSKMLTLMPAMNFDSDEWHADETVVKISGKKYYVWFIIDSETRFVLGFHVSPHRDSPQAFSLFDSVKQYGKNLMLLLLTAIQLTKCQQSLYLMFLTSELPVLKMTFPTMLLKPLTSSLNIGTRQDMVLTLLKVLIL